MSTQRFGVVRQLGVVLLALAQVVAPHAEIDVPLRARVDPRLVGRLVLARPHEVLDLHLLELARAEREVAGRDLVAERLADLGHAERQLAAHRVQHVAEVHEDPLRRLGAQVRQAAAVARVDGAHGGAEHQVERPRLGEIGGAALRALQLLGGDGFVDLGQPLRVAALLRDEHVIGAWPRLAVAAVGHRIRERRLVARVLPDQAVHQDGRVQPFHVVAVVNDRPPPGALDVVLQLDAQRPVVPGATEAAVYG
jgi:hypothetical protein